MGAGHQYETTSWWQHLVAQYAGISLLDVRDLEYIQYLTWRRDAFIYWLSQSVSGQEYLDDAWRLEQTKPDRQKLRAKYGRKEGE